MPSRRVAVAMGAGIAFGWWVMARVERARLGDAMIQAIKRGDTPRALRLLEAGADPNASTSTEAPSADMVFFGSLHGQKPYAIVALMHAAIAGNRDVATALMRRGADPNCATCEGETPLYWAAKYNRPEMVSLLLSSGAKLHWSPRGWEQVSSDDVGATAAMLAGDAGSTTVVLRLMNAADSSGYCDRLASEAARSAAANDKIETLRTIHRVRPLGIDTLNRALSAAAAKGATASVKQLLAWGAGVNSRIEQGYPPLYIACSNRQAETIAVLLGAGADVNEMDESGTSVLTIALLCGCDESVLLDLIKREARLRVDPTRAAEPMLYAAEHLSGRMIEALLRLGCDPNVKAGDGTTPLIRAARQNQAASVRALLAAGSDIHARDGRNMTALGWAELNQLPAIAKQLKLAGAEE